MTLARRLPILIAIAAAIAAIAAGCGGSSSSTTTGETGTGATSASATGSGASSPPTEGKATQGGAKGSPASGGEGAASGGGAAAGGGSPDAAFVKRANAICAHVTEGVGEDVEAYEQEHKGEGSQAQLQIEAIDAALLPRMQEDLEQVGALASKSGQEEQVAPLLEAMESALGEGEPGSTTQLIQQFKQSDALAAKFGLTFCSVS